MKRILIIAVIIAVFCIFSSCAFDKSKNKKETASEKISAAASYDEEEADSGILDDAIIFMVIPKAYRYESNINNKTQQRINKNLKYTGFNIALADSDIDMGEISNYETDKDKFIENIIESIESGQKVHALLVRENFEVIDDMADSGLFMDMSKLFKEYAPDLYVKYIDQFKNDEIYSLSFNTLMDRKSPMKNIFIVQKNLSDDFGRSIETYDDWLDFIEFADSQDVDIPCYVEDFFQITSLYALSRGYKPFGIEYGVFIKIDGSEYEPILIEQLPGFKEFIINIAGLVRDEKLFFIEKYGDFAVSRLSNISEFSIINRRYRVSKDSTVNIIHEFYPEYPPITMYTGTINDVRLMIPENSSSPEKAIEFINWLYTKQENYDQFMYGEMGYDYKLIGERLQPLDRGEPYRNNIVMVERYNWQGSDFFISGSRERRLITVPENLDNVLNSMNEQINDNNTPYSEWGIDMAEFYTKYSELKKKYESQDTGLKNQSSFLYKRTPIMRELANMIRSADHYMDERIIDKIDALYDQESLDKLRIIGEMIEEMAQ